MDAFEIRRKIMKLVREKNRPVFGGKANEWWTETGQPRRRRLIIVYNPSSSRAKYAKAEVVAPLRTVPGIMIGKFEVQPTDVDDNARKLADFLTDGDIVVTAGGDGTATVGLNGVALSGKDVRFMAVPFGNFNDMPRMLARASGGVLYPLEALVNGKHFRYAACYFTVGMFAESTEIFDTTSIRRKLQEGDRTAFFSILRLSKWYFKNRKKEFIPRFSLYSDVRVDEEKKEEAKTDETNLPEKIEEKDDVIFSGTEKVRRKVKGVSDYLAVNGITVAKFMKGEREIYKDGASFVSSVGWLTSFRRLASFMLKSMFKRIPGEISQKDNLVFSGNAEVEIQAEGEYKRFKNVSEIIIRKSDKPIKIL